MRAIIRRFATVAGDHRGMVLQETALILPVLITMILAGYDIARFSLLQQKLSRIAMTTADMVAQGRTISEPQITTIFSATGTMIQPFTAGAFQRVIVTSVSATGAAAPRVDWQRAGGGTLAGVASLLGAPGGNATLPPDFLVRNGENAIFVEVYYKFEPAFLPDLVPPTTAYHRAVFRPREANLSTICANPC